MEWGEKGNTKKSNIAQVGVRQANHHVGAAGAAGL